MRGSRSEVVLFFCVVGNCVPYDTKASGGRRTFFMAEKPAYPAPQTSLLYVAESRLSVTLRSRAVPRGRRRPGGGTKFTKGPLLRLEMVLSQAR